LIEAQGDVTALASADETVDVEVTVPDGGDVANVSFAYGRARGESLVDVAAGAEVRMPVADMFWGDRYAKVVDPFGHEWGLATHKEDLSAREIARQAEAFFSRTGGGS